MSNELDAFLEYITIVKSLSQKTVSAYRSDLYDIEVKAGKTLISLDSTLIIKTLSTIQNKRTLNRKLSSLNSFL
ncbi:MAG TPA: site-specific integrase, partial [Sulfuricurvum sp.]|nr:site-specific integrase [Sulfuricurvum sp.]